MIIGTGVDICEVNRFARLDHRATPLFYKRLLSESEYDYYQLIQNEEERAKWLTCIFAAKEAILKAIGTGIDGRFGFHTINTFNPSSHCFEVSLPISLLELYGEDVQCHLSLSFSKKVAIASVILSN